MHGEYADRHTRSTGSRWRPSPYVIAGVYTDEKGSSSGKPLGFACLFAGLLLYKDPGSQIDK